MSTVAHPTPATPLLAPPTGSAAAPTNPTVVIDGRVRIPPGITDLEAFRRWARSDEFPEKVRIAYLAGTIWVDLSMEQAFSHNDVKYEVAGVLRGLVYSSQTGRYFGDGMRLSHPAADLSTDPDGLYVSFAAVQDGRIHQAPGQHGGVVEFVGTPEMVLEVVSDSSVAKDTVEIPAGYYRAGVAEFWRIDVRGNLNFEILRRGGADWEANQLPDGWWRSHVFGHDFRLHRTSDVLGQPRYRLESRPVP